MELESIVLEFCNSHGTVKLKIFTRHWDHSCFETWSWCAAADET